jgi:urea transport system ATP-binding protein
MTAAKQKSKKISEEIFEFFPMLKQHLKRQGGLLSGGQQQQLAIARGL